MSEFLASQQTQMEDIKKFMVLRMSNEVKATYITANPTDIPEKYTVDQVFSFTSKAGISAGALYQTSLHMSYLMEKPLNDFNHLVEELQMPGTIKFSTTDLNEDEKLKFHNFLRYQVNFRYVKML